MYSFSFLLTIAVVNLATHSCAWDYATGGADWVDAGLCPGTKRQSPIRIYINETVYDKSTQLRLEYTHASSYHVVDNGHTVDVSAESADESLGFTGVGGLRYEVVGMHFHAASEHQLADNNATAARDAPLELHIVHKRDEQRLLVIGVLFKPGTEEDVYGPVDAALKLINQKANAITVIGNEDLNVKYILQEGNYKFWNYKGSLTTPPCSETVDWFVMQQAVPLAPTALAKFAAWLKYGLDRGNNRVVQNVQPVMHNTNPVYTVLGVDGAFVSVPIIALSLVAAFNVW